MREQEVAHLLTQVEEGETEALYAYATLKKYKDLFEQASKQIEPIALEEASLYPEKTFENNGFSFEKRNGARRFSFDHIQEIVKLKNEIKVLEQKSKQAFLSKEKGILVADENGEEIILPKVKYSKDSLIVRSISHGI